MTILEHPTASVDESADVEIDAWGAVEAITALLATAAAGDLEPRLPDLGDDPRLVAVRVAVNGLLDRTDAYVRESSASLSAAADKRFHRRFLVRGMQGSFRIGAETINAATSSMARP